MPSRSPDPGVSGWRLGSLRGVPVYLGSSWPIIAVVIVLLFGPPLQRALPELGMGAYAVAALYAVLLLLSVLVHEAAHAITGELRGYRVSRIVADLWGGHTAYDHADTTPGSSALVAVVGPAANGALAALAWAALPVVPEGVPRLLVLALAWSNGFVALFNLMPGLPLDGGFLVEALVWKVSGSKTTGTVVAGWCGRVVTVALLLWAIVLPLLQGRSPSLVTVVWSLFLASFLWFGATQAIRAGHGRALLARVRLRDVAEPVTVVDDTTPVAALPPGAVVVGNQARGPWGVVEPQALAGVDPAQRAQVPAGAVAVAQPAGWVTSAPSLDVDVTVAVAAVQAASAEQILVVTETQPPEVALVATARLGAALTRADAEQPRP